MAYEKLVLGVSPVTKTVFAGKLNKKGDMWLDRVDVTEQFLKCCVDYFQPNTENTLTVDGKPYLIITAKKTE